VALEGEDTGLRDEPPEYRHRKELALREVADRPADDEFKPGRIDPRDVVANEEVRAATRKIRTTLDADADEKQRERARQWEEDLPQPQLARARARGSGHRPHCARSATTLSTCCNASPTV